MDHEKPTKVDFDKTHAEEQGHARMFFPEKKKPVKSASPEGLQSR